MKPRPRAPGFDVAIVGGGPAGTALAIALRLRGLTTCLIERGDYTTPRPIETLPAEVGAVADELPIADCLAASVLAPCRMVLSSWGASDLSEWHAMTSPQGPRWNIDRARLDAALVGQASRLGTRVSQRARVVGIQRCPPGWRVSIATPSGERETVDAGFLVDATGRRAVVARQYLGIRRASLDGLIAIAADVRSSQQGSGMLMVEATRAGWWYLTSAASGEAVAVYVTDTDLSDLRNPSDAWRRALRGTHHLRRAIDGPILTASIVPARVSHLEVAGGDRWLAAGDACYAPDPLSGSGTYRALVHAARLAGVISDAISGDTTAVPEYLDGMRSCLAHHLTARAETYARETRWVSQPFWRRRVLAGSLASPSLADPTHSMNLGS